MLIRCGLNTVLVVNSVKIPNISRLSNWPLCHCEGIEDVSLTMTIINCNKFWFSTQWAFFTEQFELEANIPAGDGQMRILVIVLSPEYLSSRWTLRQCQLSDFLSFYASSWSPDTRHCDGERASWGCGVTSHAVSDRVRFDSAVSRRSLAMQIADTKSTVCVQDLECGNLYQKIELIILHSEHSSELPRHHNCSPLLGASGQVCHGVIWDGSAEICG